MESARAAAEEYLEWAVDEFLRPTLILVCGMLLFNLPTLLYKARLLLITIQYLLFCNDKRWKKPADPALVFGPHLTAGGKVERKRVYFVRHGESTWNDTFNKGKHRSVLVFVLGFFPGLVKSALYEWYLLLSGKLDSWFYDSPLSYLGLGQVEELAAFLEKPAKGTPEEKWLRILRADPGAPSSKIVSSNLRRAVSTVAGAFRERLGRRPNDKILVVSCLQEISRNPDALSITPAQTCIQASWIEKTSSVCNFQEIFSNQTDMSLHTGNKPVNSNGLKRMKEFCQFAFSRTMRDDHIIVGGHSLWFKFFFVNFLPNSINHVAKKKKIVNGGVIAFDLMKAVTEQGTAYMIDPKSITVVHGGFS